MKGKTDEKRIVIGSIILILIIGCVFWWVRIRVSPEQKQANHMLFVNARSTCILAEASCGIYSHCAINNLNKRYINSNNENINKLQKLYNDTLNLKVSREAISDKKFY